MKGQIQAFVATILLAALSVWFSPFGLLLGAVIALITLRVSETEGFKILVVAMLVNYLITAFYLDNNIASMIAIFEYMLPIWLIALVLRKTNSLASAIHLSMLMAGALLVVFHLMVGDTTLWWKNLFDMILLPFMEQTKIEFPSENIESIAKIATLVMGISAVFLWTSIIFIGRWWQSQLYYPGRFNENFQQLRLPKNVAYFAAVVIVTSLVVKSSIMQDLSGVLMAGLVFPGLAIAHYIIAIKQLKRAWLIGLYIVLIVFPQTIFIAAAIGLLDNWLDIRKRLTQKL
jgi:hypothetical protein